MTSAIFRRASSFLSAARAGSLRALLTYAGISVAPVAGAAARAAVSAADFADDCAVDCAVAASGNARTASKRIPGVRMTFSSGGWGGHCAPKSAERRFGVAGRAASREVPAVAERAESVAAKDAAARLCRRKFRLRSNPAHSARHHEAVAAGKLGAVQRGVGLLDPFGGVPELRPPLRHADAQRAMQPGDALDERTGDPRTDPLGHPLGGSSVGVAQHDTKFIAAVASGE